MEQYWQDFSVNMNLQFIAVYAYILITFHATRATKIFDISLTQSVIKFIGS